MTKIVGKYEDIDLVGPEDLLNFVDDCVEQNKFILLQDAEFRLFVEADGDNYTFTTRFGLYWERRLQFTLGKSFLEGARKAVTTVTRKDDTLIFSSVVGKKKFQRIYEFSDAGMVMTLTSYSGKKTQRICKRL